LRFGGAVPRVYVLGWCVFAGWLVGLKHTQLFTEDDARALASLARAGRVGASEIVVSPLRVSV
jgi:hypothetical protein